jgi:hypothetical protein
VWDERIVGQSTGLDVIPAFFSLVLISDAVSRDCERVLVIGVDAVCAYIFAVHGHSVGSDIPMSVSYAFRIGVACRLWWWSASPLL